VVKNARLGKAEVGTPGFNSLEPTFYKRFEQEKCFHRYQNQRQSVTKSQAFVTR